MKKSITIMILGFALILSCVGNCKANPEAPPVLMKLKFELVRAFEIIDSDLLRTAKELSKTGISGAGAERVLQRLCSQHSYAVDCAAVDPSGMVVTVRPGAYKQFEKKDISAQEQIIILHKTKKPVMSRVFTSIEGIRAIDIEYPVFTSKNEFAGSVSLLIKPEVFIGIFVGPAMKNLPGKAWVMQRDGFILYDQDPGEIGRVLFSDPLYTSYPALLDTGKQMAATRDGRGIYEFLAKGHEKVVKKIVDWTTVGIYGIEWRLAITREE